MFLFSACLGCGWCLLFRVADLDAIGGVNFGYDGCYCIVEFWLNLVFLVGFPCWMVAFWGYCLCFCFVFGHLDFGFWCLGISGFTV